MKKWTKEEIKEMLKTNDKAVLRGIVAIYNKQTSEEQQIKETNVTNGKGFNGVDARFLSSLAEQIMQSNRLTEKQIVSARKVILKYSGQLANIANEKLSN